MASVIDSCVFDDSKEITNNEVCVVGLLRKVEVNHTFIMVHAIQDNQHRLRRYDYVTPVTEDENKALEESPVTGMMLMAVMRRPGEIVIKEQTYASLDEALPAFINEYLKGDQEYLQKSWQITLDEAQALHERITAQVPNPPAYQASGDRASGPALSSQLGENCLSWCKSHLRQINDRISGDLPRNLTDILVAMPKWELPQAPEVPAPRPRRSGLFGSFK